METTSGIAAVVAAINSSSVLRHCVVAFAPSRRAQPVARLALPVRSIPTIRGTVLEFGHLLSSRETGDSTEDRAASCLTTLRLLVRGAAATPEKIGAIAFSR